MSTALIRYAAPVAARYARPAKRARTAYRAAMGIGRFAYANHASIFRAARRYKKSRKSRERRAAPSKAQTTRQTGTRLTGSTLEPSTLEVEFIEFPENRPSESYARIGPTIRMRGIKFCYHFWNAHAYAIEVHWAVLQLKAPETKTAMDTDFFRDTTQPTRRATNFASGGLYDMKQACYAINPDRFHVLMHKRKILDPKQGSTAGADVRELKNGRWFWKINKYMKMRKRLTFVTPTATQPENPIVVAFWYVAVDPSDQTTTPLVTHDSLNTVYFRNGMS